MKKSRMEWKYLRRLETFESWDKPVGVEAIAEAGFEYYRHGVVICRMCDIKLTEWEKSDVPWDEHAKHSPNCSFVRDFYGLKYKLTPEEVVDIWMEDEIIKAFESLNLIPIESIREHLLKRYTTTHKSFLNFKEATDYFFEIIFGAAKEEKKKELLLKINLVENILTKYECKICFTRPVAICFSPCNHVITCEECSSKLYSSYCPVCWGIIKKREKLFF